MKSIFTHSITKSIKLFLPILSGLILIFISCERKEEIPQAVIISDQSDVDLSDIAISDLPFGMITPNSTIDFNINKGKSELPGDVQITVFFNEQEKLYRDITNEDITYETRLEIDIDKVAEYPDSNKLSVFINDLELTEYLPG